MLQDLGCLAASEIPSLPIAMAIQSVIPSTADSIPTTISPLKRILSHLLATQGVESTILLLPSTLAQSTPKPAHAHIRRQEETPFTLRPEGHDTPSVALASNKTTNATHPLADNLPECFESAAKCTNDTNACSGHGSCRKVREKCYRCACTPTIVSQEKDGSRKKTIAWGGAACEKKDVSVPFVLFASFGVAMAALVAGGIAMLFNMGSETLPSVLSAGVSGPTARK
jgi:hypothetical protein